MLTFKDMSIAGTTPIGSAFTLINNKLKKAGLSALPMNAGGQLRIPKHPTKGYFTSAVINKVMLEADDPRIKKLGRDYLESERLTEKQWNVVVDTLTNYLQRFGVKYTLEMQEFPDDPRSISVIVKDGVVVGELPKPRSFTR